MKKYLLFISLIATLSLTGCILRKQWTGYYYPDINNIDDKLTWVVQSGLSSLEDCRKWVQSVAEDNKNYDYQCGYNCKYKKDIGETVCESDAK